ncbi:Histidine kinase [Rhodovastum atsumiense]|uniref:histidine kinase n=1 Tax=Rhodovastum atsumiense TaxID=504468 RepID=A0A5M6ITI1_9PROT|nr:PAS domain S-box protein [Rhodovastum atsumiense]KAA5611229.1 PAS domain S-box protein [Rhodovastum atsumiense]CAH2602457.1 Histidine kinase [Rhodovastum atsumiense]
MPSIQARLLLVALAALIPAIAFQAWTESEARAVRQRLIEDEALRLVRLVGAEQQRIVEGASQMLGAIGSMPDIQDRHPEACRRFLTTLLRQQQRYGDVAMLDRHGGVLCAAGPPPGPASQDHIRRALDGDGLAIGEYAATGSAGPPGLHLARAFRDQDGAVAGVAVVGLNLDWLGQQLSRLALPPGAGVVVADRTGTVLARGGVAPYAVGAPIPAGIRFMLQGDAERVVSWQEGAGSPRMIGYSPLGTAPRDLLVMVGLDQEASFATLRQADRFGLLLIVASSALAVGILALLGTVLLRRPVNQLLQVADAWRGGNFAVRTGLPHHRSGFGQLARAFDAMAEATQARERAVRESEARFRALAEAVPSMLFETDAAGTSTWKSRAWLDYVGMTATEAAGSGWTACIHPDDLPGLVPTWQAAVRTGRGYVHRHRIRRASDGAWRWHLARAVPARDADGTVLRWLGAVTDVHDLVEAQAALHERNEILQLFAERAPAGIAMFDTAMRHLAVSRRFLHNHWPDADIPPPQTVIGRSHYEVFPWIPEHWREAHRRVLAGETLSAEEQCFTGADGRTEWGRWEMTPWYRADGGIGGAVLFTEVVTQRRQAEAALRESEQRFRQIADAAPVMIWISDTTGDCTWFNRPWLAFTGRTMEQELGDGWADGVHPEDRDVCLAVYRDAVARRTSFRMEYRLRRADGKWRIVDDTGVTRLGEDGAFLGHIGSLVDVTEARRAEAALRQTNESLEARIAARTLELQAANHQLAARIAEREQVAAELRRTSALLRAIGTCAPDLMYAKDLDGCYLFANPAALDVYGRPAGAVLGHTDLQWHHDPLEATALMRNDRWVLRSGRTQIIEESFASPGRATRLYRSAKAPLRLDDGTVIGIVGVSGDITQIKATEAALRRSEERFRAIFEQAAVGMAVIGLDGRWLQVNDKLCAITGYSREEFATLTVRAITHPDDIPQTVALKEQLVAGTIALHQLEKRYRRKDGSHVWINGSAALLRDAEGRPEALVAVIEDITERRRAEAALRQAQKMEALGNIAGGIAHDFNNLLAVIISHIELLEIEDSPASRHDLAAEMLRAAMTGAELTHRLLAFARVQPLRTECIATAEAIGSIARLLRRVLGDHISLSLDLAPGLWPILADRAELETCLLNLATNARDAMPEGGRLRLAAANARLGAEDPAREAALPPGDYVRLAVADSGQGMDAALLGRIFDPFFTTKGLAQGTGLGLSTVFGFIRQLGGHIAVASAPGEGTTFTLFIPRADEPAPPRAGHAAQAGLPAGRGETILVVEDNAALRRIAVRHLEALNYAVLEAADGPSALALLRRRDVALLFSDVALPNGMTGIALARQAQAAVPSLRVLLTSGFPGTAGPGMAGTASTGFPLLAKPYRLAALAEAVDAALQGSSATKLRMGT